MSNMAEEIQNYLDTYRRIYQEELLTEEAERISYTEGVIDGLMFALGVVKGADHDNTGENKAL